MIVVARDAIFFENIAINVPTILPSPESTTHKQQNMDSQRPLERVKCRQSDKGLFCFGSRYFTP